MNGYPDAKCAATAPAAMRCGECARTLSIPLWQQRVALVMRASARELCVQRRFNARCDCIINSLLDFQVFHCCERDSPLVYMGEVVAS